MEQEQRSHSGMGPSQIQPVTEVEVFVVFALLLAFFVVAGMKLLEGDLSLAGFLGTLVAIVAALFFIEIALTQITVKRFAPLNEEGVSALGRGELERAVRIWRPWTKRPSFIVRSMARHNLAAVYARSGDLEQAIRTYIENERRKQPAFLRDSNALGLAFACTLAGKDELAGAWLGVAEDRVAKQGPGKLADFASTKAALLCRRGDAPAALALLDKHWSELETHVRANDMRSRRVMRAFIASSAAGPREAGASLAAIDGIRPAFPGEFDWLGVEWPEMRAFLQVHGLASQA